MQLEIRSRMEITSDADGLVLLNVEAQPTERQRIEQELFTVLPQAQAEEHRVPETGNRYRKLHLGSGTTSVEYSAHVTTSLHIENSASLMQVPLHDLPFDVIPHLYASRYCPSDAMASFAWQQFGNTPLGFARVEAICDWVNANVAYRAGVSVSTTTAADTLQAKAGVCRDFAHLVITICRALGMPARYVSAYALNLEPPDFHAVVEVYLSGRWFLFDATRLCPLDGIVKIAVGRDAADTAFMTSFGNISSTPALVEVSRIDGGGDVPSHSAISISSI
jgi:transglutaminase-like putative cysteine protease